MKRTVVALAAALVAGAGVAQSNAEPTPGDFAYGAELQGPGEAALYRFSVPPVVYEDAVRADLGDVRVFNAGGDTVPFSIDVPASTSDRAKARRALRFFPLTRRAQAEPDADLRDRQSGAADGAAAEERVYGYLFLVDEEAPGRLDALRLALSGDGRGVGTTRVSVSDDLQHWRTVRRGVPLAHLRFRGEQLGVDRIDLGGVQARYLRITWPEPLDGVDVDGVVGRFSIGQPAPPLHWRRAMPDGAPGGGDMQGRRFDTGGVFPVSAWRLDTGKRNAVARVALASRATEEAGWHPRASGLYYDVRIDGTDLQQRELQLPRPVTDRSWRLRLRPASVLDVDTTVEFGWRPHEIRFVAQGAGPYTLAWGSVDAGPARDLAELVDALDDPGAGAQWVEVGERIELGGPARLAPPPEPIPWSRYGLWAILALAVIAVLWMARRLLREMGGGTGD